MTFTLFDLTYKVAVALGAVLEGTATGGSTTTVVDTVRRLEADGFWTRGTVWILRDAAGGGAAPEREASVVSGFVQSTNTITVETPFTVAVAAGDKYAVAKRRYPLNILTQKINAALDAMGPIPITDYTTIPAIASGQSEYSLPLAAGMDLREVYYSMVDDPDDHQWIPVLNWSVQESAVGTPDLLILPGPFYRTGGPVKLVYMGLHPQLHLMSDKLSDSVHPDRVTVEAALLVAQWRLQKMGGSDPSLPDTMGRLDRELVTLPENRPILAPAVQSALLIVKRAGRRYPGDRNPR